MVEAGSALEGRPKKRCKVTSGIRRDFSKSRTDWSILLQTGKLDAVRSTRTRVTDEKIRYALTFLFRRENTQLLSWICIRIRFNG